MVYLKALVADPLFMRVCMLLWGGPMVAFGAFVLFSWSPTDAVEWIGYLLFTLLALLGSYLVATALAGREERLDRVSNFMSDGGDIVGSVAALAFCLVALPIVAIARLVWPRHM
jgi:hypothetical protein